MFRCWILLVALFAAYSEARCQEVTAGDVNMPLAEFKELWKELEQAKRAPLPDTPPLGAILSSANLEISPGENSLRIRSSFEVQALDDRWNAIALQPASSAVLTTEPTDAAFAVFGDAFCLFSSKRGKQTAVVESAVAAPGWTEGQPVTLIMPNAASISLRTDADQTNGRVSVEGAVLLADGKYAAQPKANVRLRLIPAGSQPKPELPPRWRASREVFAKLENERVSTISRVVLRLEENEGWSATLLVPAAARIANVKSDDLADSRVERFDEKWNRLLIRWSSATAIQREVFIEASLPPPIEASKWRLEPPLLEGEKDPLVWFSFTVPSDYEVEINGAQQPAAGSEPGLWLQRMSQDSRHRYAIGKPDLLVSLKAPSVLETPQVTCSALAAQSRLVSDGALVTDVTYSLKHEQGSAVRINLPAGASLLSCSIAKGPIQPVKERDGAIRIRLSEKSQDTKLEFSFHQKREPWDPLRGRFAVSLPRAALMIERVDWRLLLPEGYDMEAFEGNVVPVTGQNAFTFQKELCNDEAPFLELFYKKRGLGN